MVALSCACLATRGVEAVVICLKAGSSGDMCELWVWQIAATAALSNSICMWIMRAVCAVESHRDEYQISQMWSRGDAPARRDDDGIELAGTAEAG